MTTVVVVEVENGRASDVSEETLTFARRFDGEMHALVLAPGEVPAGVVTQCAEQGVVVIHTAAAAPESYAPAAWATVTEAAIDAAGAGAVLAAGTPRGLEVLAHVAARRDVPMAANAIGTADGDTSQVLRQIVGGQVVEVMALPAGLQVIAVAGHAVEAESADAPGAAAVSQLSVEIPASDLRASVSRVELRESSGDASALTGAKVVVGAGRGAGSASGFGDVDALAARLGGVVGVSRVVTSLGWRPHYEQVGQTGSRISPDVYIPCGISGAIQHWAGCQSSKTIIAINTDRDAPMVTKATYAVIGDMHEVLPAVLTELGPA